jgi:hypothetical protein
MPIMATRLRFTGTGDGTHFIDLSKEMSAFHRRMHRSGRYYNVTGGYIVDSASNTRIDFATAPDHWTMKNAYKRGFRMWKKNRAQILQNTELGVIVPKYSDFKVYLNNAMGVGTLRSVDAAGNAITVGEYEYAELRDLEQDNDFNLMLVGQHTGTGPNWTRVSLLQSWFESRPLQDVSPAGDPAPAAEFDDPLVNIFNDSDSDDHVIADIEAENQLPPYDRDGALGNQQVNSGANNLQRKATAKLAVGGPGLTHMPGFGAMCGLIQVDVTGATGAWEFVLDVEVGGKILE